MGPISFLPLFMDRVWGGRRLEEVFGKPLPPDVPIGESWELVDRSEAQSISTDGTPLHELWTQRREEIFGPRAARYGERFPLLIKLLDAREALSVQVHPPASAAAALGGEPKSEMWFLADADPGAHLLVGLRRGVTREAFTSALEAGEDVSALLHRIDVSAGDAIYLPSGRVHAIGPGCLILEVQQNSDTTYRVFDYGRPRELHVEQSMASIDWDDVEPPLLPRDGDTVVETEYFTVSRRAPTPGECAIVCVLSGNAECGGETFAAGDVFLVPATIEDPTVTGEVLVIELPA
ncbi:MAG TPA: type I phosphomannose isomerase catalytic subunit [Solirubrobacteraceae bacterium]